MEDQLELTEEHKISYKYNEDKILEELQDYIFSTYSKHYSNNKKTQTLDLIMELPDGPGFLKGNIIKYASRFQKKKDNPKEDLMKLLHYAVLLYHFSFMIEDQ